MKKLELFDKENLFADPTEEDYTKARAEYIANYQEYRAGYSTGLFGWREGEYIKKPAVGEANWNKLYPAGYEDWLTNHGGGLSRHGQRQLVRQHDELVKAVNKLIEKNG